MTSATKSPQRVVLCLHGFPDNDRSYRFQRPALEEAGFSVVTPLLRGYEPTSQPSDGDYSVSAMADDVMALLDGLGVHRAHLVGHDWGAVIAYVAAARAPERFESLTTLAIPHPGRLVGALRHAPSQLRKSWYMSFFQLRGLSEWALERDDWALVRGLWRAWSPSFELPQDEWAALRSTFSAPGVKRAMLAYYRQNTSPTAMLGIKKTSFNTLKTIPVRTLAITGAEDGCMDTRLHDHTFDDADFPCGFRVARIEGAGHFVHQERPEAVNAMLLDWLAQSAQP